MSSPAVFKRALCIVLANTLGLELVRATVEMVAGGRAMCEVCGVEGDMRMGWTGGDRDEIYDHRAGVSLVEFYQEGVAAKFKCRVELVPGSGAMCGCEGEVRGGGVGRREFLGAGAGAGVGGGWMAWWGAWGAGSATSIRLRLE